MSTTDDARFADRLEPFGLAAGAFLVLVGILTIVGMPWQTLRPLAGAIQTLGGVAAIGVGAALAWLARLER